MHITATLPLWVALAGAASAQSIPTKVYNASAGTTNLPNSDFSNEQLEFLWNQVGPIATHSKVSALAEATPEATWARPGQFHPLVASTFGSNITTLQLPKDFAWGLSASSYQIDGAAKDGGKGPSIWDLLSHRVPGYVVDDTNGDTLGQHYYLYKQDFARLKAFGTPWYSPSISWPRLFPFGKGPVNEEAVKHYDAYIAELVNNGIKPALSLFHWDTPLALFNEYGAWSSPKIVDDYFNYAKWVITRYDEFVPVWFTINEPQYCNWQYSYYPVGQYYPSHGFKKGMTNRFLCGHYTLLAHAKIAKWYHEEFKGKGKITFKNSGNYFQPLTESAEDAAAVARSYDFVIGWFGGPWEDGDYPQTLKDALGDILPVFTEEEKELIKGSCDFYAIDAYTAYHVGALPDGELERCASNRTHPAWPDCSLSSSNAPDSFLMGPSADPGVSWLKSTPAGIRKFLNHITKVLHPSIPEIMVSEFGFAEPFESEYTNIQDATWDLRRADYIQGFLDNILLAIHEDGVNVTGAFAWSIYDNFEWGSGSVIRFGLQYLNYTSLERTPKASMFQLLDWFKKHGGTFLSEA